MELLADFLDIERRRMRSICRNLTHTVSDNQVLYESEEFTTRLRRTMNSSRLLLIRLIELLESDTPLQSLPSVSLLIQFDDHIRRIEELITLGGDKTEMKSRILHAIEIHERVTCLSDILSSMTFLSSSESFHRADTSILNREPGKNAGYLVYSG
jgi:hypothetical protein